MQNAMRLLLSIFFLITPLLAAAPLTQGERDRAMSLLHATRKQVLDAVANLSPEQWNFKQAPDRWSIAEVAEHITVTEAGLFHLVERMLKEPPPDGLATESQGKDARVQKEMTDRTRRFRAPGEVAPTGRFAGRAEFEAAFKSRRDETIRYLQTTPDDLRGHGSKHGLFGVIDAYQWLLIIGSHTERHLLQIDEVKRDSAFPKR